MIVDCNNPLWRTLYINIRNTLPNTETGYTSDTMAKTLLQVANIQVHRDWDGRWSCVELPDGDELILLLLKYGS